MRKLLMIVLLICGGAALVLAQSATPEENVPNSSPLGRRAARTRDELNIARMRYESLQGEIRKETGRLEVTSATLHQAAAAMDDQVQALQLSLLSSQVRMDAIARAMDQLAHDADAAAAKDEAVAELGKVAAAREQTLATYKQAYSIKTVALAEVQARETELAEARAQVAMQRERVVASLGGDSITAMKKELLDLQIDRQDDQAKLEFLQDQLKRLGQGIRELNDMEDAQAKIDDLRKQMIEVGQQMDAATLQEKHP
jgi:chromosome segregation ATPase